MKKLLLVLALIGVVILTAYGALSGTYTTNGYFYLPGYGSYGAEECNEYNRLMEIADNQIEDNKTASGDENIQDVAGAMWTGNTETGLTITYQGADGTVDAVIGDDDIVESMLKFVNTPNDEEIGTYESTTGDFEWHTLAELSIQPLDATLTALAGLTIGANELIYGTGADAFSMLTVNATATNKFLRQVSSGAPNWEALVAGDIPDISATYQPLDTALTNMSALTYVSPSFIKLTANDTYAVRTLAQTLTDIGGAASGANADITSMTGLSNDGIPLAKVANAASDGANDDITSITGLTTPLGAAYGGTGVANNAASTITITGAYTLGLTLSNNTALTLPTAGTVATTSNKLSAFAATTSAELAGVISDETGSGLLVFSDSPLIYRVATVAPSLTWGAATAFAIRNENTEIVFGLDANDPWYSYIQGRSSGSAARPIMLNPLGGIVGIGTRNASGTLDINVPTNADVHILLSENNATKWDFYNDHNDDNLQVLSVTTLRYEFGTDGTAVADVAWGTFSPVVEGVGKELLAIALKDANKPVKPYEGIPTVKTDNELFDMIPTSYEVEVPVLDDEGNQLTNPFGKPLFEIVTEVKDEKVYRLRKDNEFATEAEKQVEYDKYHKVPAKISIANAKYLEYLTGIIDAMQLKIDELETRIMKLENLIEPK